MLVCLAGLVEPASGLAVPPPRTAAPGGSTSAAATAGHPADSPAASAPPAAPAVQPPAAAGAVVLWGEAGLTAAQAQQLRRIALAARRWRAALPALAAVARQQGDTALLDALARLDALLQQLAATQRLTRAAYLAALSASDQALSLWAADAAALTPGEQGAEKEAETGAADLTTAADTGFVFSADLSAGTAWTYAEGPPPGDAGAAASDAGPGGPGAADGGPSDAGGGDMAGDPGSPFPGGATGPVAPAPVATIDTSGRPEAEGADLAGVSDGNGALAPAATQGAGAALGMAQGGSAEDALVMPAALDGLGGSGRAGAAGSGWVVIRGGPDASWQPEGAVSTMGAPMLAPEAGDPREGDLASDGSVAAPEDDPVAGEPAAFGWGEMICRPWQPDAGTASVCPVSALPPRGAVEP